MSVSPIESVQSVPTGSYYMTVSDPMSEVSIECPDGTVRTFRNEDDAMTWYVANVPVV